jgi:hypothetical protein
MAGDITADVPALDMCWNTIDRMNMKKWPLPKLNKSKQPRQSNPEKLRKAHLGVYLSSMQLLHWGDEGPDDMPIRRRYHGAAVVSYTNLRARCV